MRFETGSKLEPFCCNTIDQDGVSAEQLVNGKPTMFLFLRYYGCRICQLDLRDLDRNYEQIRSAGGQAVVILQSKRAVLEKAAVEKAFPCPVVCDPDQELYKMFGILPAADKEGLTGGNAAGKVKRAAELGLVHGVYEGNELQLPAAVLVVGEMTIRYAHSGENAADIPGAEEIAGMIEALS